MLSNTFHFPLWQYLNQRLFRATDPLILSPRQFTHHYRVQLLERCLLKSWESQEQRD